MDDIGRLAIIGSGAMGSAFAEGMISAGVVAPSALTLADIDSARLEKLASELGVAVTTDNASAVKSADVVLLVVKPPLAKEVLAGVRDAMTADKLLISIVTGLKIDDMEASLPPGVPVIRCMPNTPARIRQGAIGFSRGTAAKDKHVQVAGIIFNSVGIAFEVPEKMLNAVTGLSGSGPAYIYLLIEALSDAGVRVGLTRNVALKLGAQTVAGAARMVLELNEHPARLKDQVTTPGGTTIAGIDALERAGFRSAIMEAVKAATKRADELG